MSSIRYMYRCIFAILLGLLSVILFYRGVLYLQGTAMDIVLGVFLLIVFLASVTTVLSLIMTFMGNTFHIKANSSRYNILGKVYNLKDFPVIPCVAFSIVTLVWVLALVLGVVSGLHDPTGLKELTDGLAEWVGVLAFLTLIFIMTDEMEKGG